MTTYQDFPMAITSGKNKEGGFRLAMPQYPRFATSGSLFLQCEPGASNEKIAWVRIPEHHKDTAYLVHIALTMLSAPGGDFDDEDTVYADIFSIGVDPNGNMKPDAVLPRLDNKFLDNPNETYGGVWGHHFGDKALDRDHTMGISTYIGPIQGDFVKLRLVCRGAHDNDIWAGASYFVLEVGMHIHF
jgi:hypothetical protein